MHLMHHWESGILQFSRTIINSDILKLVAQTNLWVGRQCLYLANIIWQGFLIGGPRAKSGPL